MLGHWVSDPLGIEGLPGETPGLGLLNVTTEMTSDKRVTRTHATHVATGTPIVAYGIHIGTTTGTDRSRPFALVNKGPEGATSPDGRIMGSYLHGMFTHDGFRKAFLQSFGTNSSLSSYTAEVETTLDALANHMEAHLDMTGLLGLAR